MTIDVERARADTPGCRSVVHLNHAGASLMPAPVVDAVTGHLELEARIGGYEAAARNSDAIDRVYAAAGRLLGCDPLEVAFAENATRAWDMAFYALPLEPGDRILTSEAEYASNYVAFLHRARSTGAVIEVIPSDEHGQLSVDALRDRIDKRTKLVAVTHVPTNGGLVNPAAAIGKVTAEAGVPFLLDACQSAGQLPLDVSDLGCDILSLTGRKYLRGPRGTGLLYVRRSLAERLTPPLLDLHAATWDRRDGYDLRAGARRFENWESNVAGKVGLGVAIDYAVDLGLEQIWTRVHTLGEALRARLEAVPGARVTDIGATRCGIVSFTMADEDPVALRDRLRAVGINVWVSTAASTRIDMERRGLDTVVRASVHYLNTEAELDRLCDHLVR